MSKYGYILLIATSLLFSIGILMVFNTTSAEVLDKSLEVNTHRALLRQVIYGIIGICIGLVVYSLNYKNIIKQPRSYLLENHDKLLSLNFVCKLENLQTDLINNFEKYNLPLGPLRKLFLKRMRKRNTTKHRHYSTYYNDETRKLVALKDSIIIDKYNYTFKYE